jgi:hypothetical protein
MAERHWTQSGLGIAKKTAELTFKPLISVYKARSAEADERAFETAKKAAEFAINAGPQIATTAVLTIPAVATGVAGLGSLESRQFAQEILGKQPLVVQNMTETYRIMGSTLYLLTTAALTASMANNINHVRNEFVRIFKP